MKTKLILLIALVAGCTMDVTRCFAQTDGTKNQSPAPAVESSPESWKELTREPGFRIVFPGTPIEEDNSADVVTGRKFIVKTTAYYFVGYQDFPPSVAAVLQDVGPRKQFLDALRDRVTVQSRAKVLNEEDISIDDHPGRFLTLGMETGGILRQYVCFVGRRVYQIIVITPSESKALDGGRFDEMRAMKFLKSFKLVSNGP